MINRPMSYSTTGAHIFFLLLVMGCEQSTPTTTTDIPTQGAKSQKIEILAVVENIIRHPGQNIQFTRLTQSGKGPLAVGDKVIPGDTLQTDDGIQATVKFGDHTTVFMQEATTLRVHPSGQLEPIGGAITISRQIGAPVPTTLRIHKKEYSVINGNVSIQRNPNGPTQIKVVSGEIIDLTSKGYIYGGQTISIEGETTQTLSTGLPSPPPLESPPSISGVLERLPVSDQVAHTRGIGTLVARNPRTGKTNQHAMEMTRHAVDISISDGVALTKIEEAFTNNSNATVEATYKFVLPSDGSISRLALDVNGKIEEGEVLEKKRAMRIFKQIVDDAVRPRDPALLEWEKGSSFSMKIFPIKPGETRRVFISYIQILTPSWGHTRYVYPLGGPGGTPKVKSFSLNAIINTSTGLNRISTPMYSTDIQSKRTSAQIAYRASNQSMNSDFVIEFDTEIDGSSAKVSTQTELTGEQFAVFLINPEMDLSTSSPGPRRILGVVDTSYGISEELGALSRGTIMELMGGLTQQDRFNILACDSSCTPVFKDYVSAGAVNINDAFDKLAAISPGGATNLHGALETAYTYAKGSIPTQIIYVGDGIPTAGETQPTKLINRLWQTKPQGVSVHTVGIGPDVDGLLLKNLAVALGGWNYNLSVNESPAAASWKLSQLVNSTGIKNVSVNFETRDGHFQSTLFESMYPTQLGFIPNGESISLVGKLQTPLSPNGRPVKMRITGELPDGKKYEKSYSVHLAPSPPAPGFASKIWAKQHLDHLQFTTQNAEHIVTTSRKYRVASRLTSWIVLENQRMYDQFNVQRTNAAMWDGSPAIFDEISEGDDKETEEEQDLAELADDDFGFEAISQSHEAFGTAGSAPSSSGAKMETKKAKRKKSSRPSKPDRSDRIASGGGWSSRPIQCVGGDIKYNIKITPASEPNPRMLEKAAQLKSKVDAYPLSRKTRRQYVRHLSKIGDIEQSLAAADSWRQADPLGNSALNSYAGELARHGNRYEALRAYAAVSDVNPTNTKIHLRLAHAYRQMGDYVASAGHYKAAVNLSKKHRNETMTNYLFSLAAAGHHNLLTIEAQDVKQDPKFRSIWSAVDQLLLGIQTGVLPLWPEFHYKGDMSINLIVSDGQDLDISVIDPYGRRISGLWQHGASVQHLTEPGQERLSLYGLINGRYSILISKTHAQSQTSPISGTLKIRVKDKHRTIPFTITGTDMTVAQVHYSKRRTHRKCY